MAGHSKTKQQQMITSPTHAGNNNANAKTQPSTHIVQSDTLMAPPYRVSEGYNSPPKLSWNRELFLLQAPLHGSNELEGQCNSKEVYLESNAAHTPLSEWKSDKLESNTGLTPLSEWKSQSYSPGNQVVIFPDKQSPTSNYDYSIDVFFCTHSPKATPPVATPTPVLSNASFPSNDLVWRGCDSSPSFPTSRVGKRNGGDDLIC